MERGAPVVHVLKPVGKTDGTSTRLVMAGYSFPSGPIAELLLYVVPRIPSPVQPR